MTGHYILYAKPSAGAAKLTDGEPLYYVASNQLAVVAPGDTVWLVTASDGNLTLLGRVEVSRVLDKAEAGKQLGIDDLWVADIYALPYEPKPIRRVDLMPIVHDLLFESRGAEQLLIKDGRINPQQLQSLRKLTHASAALLDQVWAADDLTFVKNVTEVRGAVRAFNAEAAEHPNRTRSLLAKTRYWIFDEATGQFAPTKFAGLSGMDFPRYEKELSRMPNDLRFDGSRTRQAVEEVVGPFTNEEELRDRLSAWGQHLLTNDPFVGVDPAKWRFVRIRKKPLPTSSKFTVGAEYTRDQVCEILGVLEDQRGGDWTTGYHRHEDDWFLFVNLGVAGRTGHDYANRWDGDCLTWQGKTGSKIKHPTVQSLLEPPGEVLVFTREVDRGPFHFAGPASPAEYEDTVPVTIRWRFLTSSVDEEEALDALQDARSRRHGGQGIKVTPEVRKAIENHAMKAAKAYFVAQGYEVEDVSKNHPYDLRCRRRDEVVFVEVKGTKTAGKEVLLTKGEVRFAKEHADQMALFELNGIVVTEGDSVPVASGGEARILQPWVVENSELSPIGYEYRVPSPIEVVPAPLDMLFPSIEAVVDSFKRWLLVRNPKHHTAFVRRLQSNQEAARAEAVVFSVLRSQQLEVSIGEDPSQGGVDFICNRGDTVFVAEVSSLGKDAVSEWCGVKNLTDGAAFSYSFITEHLRDRVSSKALQLSDHSPPRTLFLTTEHIMGSELLGPHGAKSLLTSDAFISVPIGSGSHSEATDLKESAFFRFAKSGEIVPCRKSISAIFLVNIQADECTVCGLAHPDPAVPFQLQLLPTLPIARLQTWPPESGNLQVEWITHSPSAARFPHRTIHIFDEDLRGGVL